MNFYKSFFQDRKPEAPMDRYLLWDGSFEGRVQPSTSGVGLGVTIPPRLMGLALGLLLGASHLMAQQGMIRGTIFGPSQARVPSVAISAVRVLPIGTLKSPPVRTVYTGPSGLYLIDALEPATYKLCVMPRGVALLDPCMWSEAPPLVNVVSGQESRVNITLEEGAWLYVNVQDPGQALAAKENAGRGAQALEVRVGTIAGPFENLTEVSRGQKERSYRIALPKAKDIPLVLGTDALDVQDSQGKGLGLGRAQQTIRLDAGSRTIEFKVANPSPGGGKN